MKLSRGYYVRFVHTSAPLLLGPGQKRATVCTLTVPGGVSFRGWAFCSKKDVFSRERGRKLALARALRYVPRPERAVVWLAYFEATGDPRDVPIKP